MVKRYKQYDKTKAIVMTNTLTFHIFPYTGAGAGQYLLQRIEKTFVEVEQAMGQVVRKNMLHGKTVRRVLPWVERLVYRSKLPRALLTPPKKTEEAELVQIDTLQK